MATILDAFMVTFGIDPSGVKKGAKEVQDHLEKTGKAAKKPSDELETMGKKAAEAMGKFRNELLRTAAVLVGFAGIKSFVSDVTKSDAALGRTAANVRMSTQELSKWQLAAESAGGTAESMTQDIKGFVGQFEQMSVTGKMAPAIPFLRAIGVAATDAKGQLLPMTETLLNLSDKLSAMSPEKAQQVGSGIGLSEDTINLLHQGRAAVKAYLDEAARANARTSEDTKNAQDRQKAWALLTATFNRLATDVLNKVSPALVGLMDFIRGNAGPAAVAVGGLAAAMTALSLIRFGGLVSSLSGLLGGVGGLAGLGAGGPFVAGIAALAAAVFALAGVVNLMDPDKKSDADKHPGEHWVAGKGRSGAGGYWERDDGRINGIRMPADPDAIARGVAAKAAAAASVASSTPGSLSDKQAFLASLEKQWNLPAGLLDSVWQQESTRGKNMLSPAGAKGDFGFMDKTATAYGVDVKDFKSSATGAAHMFSDLLKQYKGNLPMALAAYNGGSGHLDKVGLGGMLAETQRYLPSVMANMRGGSSVANNSNSSEVHIAQLNVQTQSKDPDGIARGLPSAIKRQQFALQGNTGLTP